MKNTNVAYFIYLFKIKKEKEIRIFDYIFEHTKWIQWNLKVGYNFGWDFWGKKKENISGYSGN